MTSGKLAALVGQSAQIDVAIKLIWRRRAVVLRYLFFWQPLQCFLTALEIWLALRFLGAPVSLTEAVVLESLIQAVSSAAFFVPGGLGVQEGGFILIGGAIGLDPSICLALAGARRIRDLLIFVPGLMAWQFAERVESRVQRNRCSQSALLTDAPGAASARFNASRKRQFHRQPAATDARAHLQVRIEMLRNPRDDRETQAAAGGLGTGRAEKPVRQMGEVVRRDTGAVVTHDELHAAVCMLHAHLDSAVFTSVLDRVIEQVVEHDAGQHRLGVDFRARGHPSISYEWFSAPHCAGWPAGHLLRLRRD